MKIHFKIWVPLLLALVVLVVFLHKQRGEAGVNKINRELSAISVAASADSGSFPTYYYKIPMAAEDKSTLFKILIAARGTVEWREIQFISSRGDFQCRDRAGDLLAYIAVVRELDRATVMVIAYDPS
jgi:hypothetical protein